MNILENNSTNDYEHKLPFEILNGEPGYINYLDAINSWQLERNKRYIKYANIYII